jgi:hypothetical protein
MNENIDLQNLLANKNVNCVEVYIRNTHTSSKDSSVIPLHGMQKSNIVTFGSGHTMTIKNYYYKDLCYSYDTVNDAQRVIKRAHVHDYDAGNGAYVLCINEDTLPSHRFPCVNEVSHTNNVLRTSYRINNRMYVNHESVNEDGVCTEIVYVRYNHAPQVDLKQMQNDMDKVLKLLHKSRLQSHSNNTNTTPSDK